MTNKPFAAAAMAVSQLIDAARDIEITMLDNEHATEAAESIADELLSQLEDSIDDAPTREIPTVDEGERVGFVVRFELPADEDAKHVANQIVREVDRVAAAAFQQKQAAPQPCCDNPAACERPVQQQSQGQ